MGRPIKNLGGVTVKITEPNSRKLIKIIRKTKRTFAVETNIAVEEYKPKALFIDNGK